MPPPVATFTTVGRLQWPERCTASPNGAAATARPANRASTAAIAATTRLVIAHLPLSNAGGAVEFRALLSS
jgi:hypothetical protein